MPQAYPSWRLRHFIFLLVKGSKLIADETTPISYDDSLGRGITASLTFLDRILYEFEQYARGREAVSVFFKENNTLTENQKADILREIGVMRDELKLIKATLGLKGKRENVSRKMIGQAAGLWESLVETDSEHLKRYGDVSPEFSRFFDPKMAALIEHMQVIVTLVGGRDAIS